MADELAVQAAFNPSAVGRAEDLRPLCDVLATRNGSAEWTLRESVRVATLGRLLHKGWAGVRAARRRVTLTVPDTALQEILDAAIEDRMPPVDQLAEDQLVAALRVSRWLTNAIFGSRREIYPELPAGLARDPIEARLALLQVLRPIHELTADGCLGREDELVRLREFAFGPVRGVGVLGLPALQVYGVGGMGKSTLVAAFVRELSELAELSRPAWAYLDLDRPTLAAYEPGTILREVMNQVAAQLPAAKRHLEGAIRELVEDSAGQGLESTYLEAWRYRLPDLVTTVMEVAGGRLVVVLDTFEEVQRDHDPERSDYAAQQVFELFQQLSSMLPRFRLIISGRAPVDRYLESADPAQLLEVRELEDLPARALLRHFYAIELGIPDPVPLSDDLAASVVEIVGGSPLTLRLASQVLAGEGPAGITDTAARIDTLALVRRRFIRGFLYQRILDHLGGPGRELGGPLPEIARAALALREVTPGILAEVILPAVQQPPDAADFWFETLRRERALAYEPRDAPGERVLRIREDLRGPALRALGYEREGLVRQLHEAAAGYYAHHDQLPRARRERAYHWVAAGLAHDEVELGALDKGDSDLPAEVRTAAEAGALSELGLARLAEQALERLAEQAIAEGDLASAAMMLADRSRWSSGTTLYRLVTTVTEGTGTPEEADAAASRDLAAAVAAGSPDRYAAAAVRQALLRERWQRARAGAEVLAEAAGHELLAGRPALRLQLVLNRIALLERLGDEHAVAIIDLSERAVIGELRGSEATEVAATLREAQPVDLASLAGLPMPELAVNGLVLAQVEGARCALVATEDGILRVWDIERRRLLAEFAVAVEYTAARITASLRERADVVAHEDERIRKLMGVQYAGQRRLLAEQIGAPPLASTELAESAQPIRMRDGTDERWIGELDARALLAELGPEVRSDTALIRLLAATLGRDEPERLRTALLELYLGPTPDATRIRALADTIAVCDRSFTPAGGMAVRAGVRVHPGASPAEVTQAWVEALRTPSTTGGPLERLWAVERPPTPVLEALRAFYLWWDRPADRWDRRAATAPASLDTGHFLDGELDFDEPRLVDLLRVLGRAYPSTGDLMELGSHLDLLLPDAMEKQRPAVVLRELLSAAGRRGEVGRLVAAILDDPKIGVLADSIRTVIGPDWLAAHHIQEPS